MKYPKLNKESALNGQKQAEQTENKEPLNIETKPNSLNDYRQKLTDKIISEMSKQRVFDEEGMKDFVKTATENLNPEKDNLHEVILTIVNWAFNVGFNKGLEYSIKLTNQIDMEK